MTRDILAGLLLSAITCSCASTVEPVEFISASGDMHGTVDLRVQGVPVRVELDTVTTTEGEPVQGRAALLTPLGGVECDLLPDDADCHQVEAAPFPAREETATNE